MYNNNTVFAFDGGRIIFKTAFLDNYPEEKINIVKQHVTLDDWNNILKGKTTWKFEFDMNNACQIKCSIDDLLTNMVVSLGLS